MTIIINGQEYEPLATTAEIANDKKWAKFTIHVRGGRDAVVITGAPKEVRSILRHGLEGLRSRHGEL